MESGCDDFIQKPFRTYQIFEAMKVHLGVRYLYKADEAIAEQASRSDTEPIDSHQLHQLPSQLIASLEAATQRLQWRQILDIIERIRLQDERLAEALSSTVHRFQYEKILEAIGSRQAP